MRRVCIEVSPRIGDPDDYHACLKGDTSIWGWGESIEVAVASFIAAYHYKLDLTAEELESCQGFSPRPRLRALLTILAERDVELEIVFLPTVIR